MPYNVTSWFVDQCAVSAPLVKRKFLLGSSDYSDRVINWPSISRTWNDVRPLTVSIGLANEDKLFNFFHLDKTNLRAAAELQLGFTHPSSGDEMITLFSGTAKRVSYANGQCNLTLGDKFSSLSERVIGTSNSAAIFSGATMLPSDIAWTICTCYGGLSSVQSTSNPDIDYEDFNSWAGVFSGDSVYMGARFEGQTVTEALRKLAKMTVSAVVLDGEKISFARYTTTNTQTVTIDNDSILDISVDIDDSDMVNKQFVYADWRVASRFWNVTVVEANSASVNSYGVRERVLSDESVWYVSSQNAYNAAQRIIRTAGRPYDRMTLKTPLKSLHQQVGDTIIGVDTFLGVDAGWRIMKQSINMNDGSLSYSIDPSQVNTPFTLDVSSLDGGDLLL